MLLSASHSTGVSIPTTSISGPGLRSKTVSSYAEYYLSLSFIKRKNKDRTTLAFRVLYLCVLG